MFFFALDIKRKRVEIGDLGVRGCVLLVVGGGGGDCAGIRK